MYTSSAALVKAGLRDISSRSRSLQPDAVIRDPATQYEARPVAENAGKRRDELSTE